MKIIENLTKSLVLISKCTEIFRNLALEDLVYNCYNKNGFKGENNIIIIWRNDPCVVIGRHQNVWAEVNISKCAENNSNIARRRSGGGTVYHDLENINLTFFSNREKYDRKRNLQCVSNILKKNFQIDCEINNRDDLILNGNLKISGSAAKLGSKIAYHHFTLLVNSDLEKIKTVLQPYENLIDSRATNSTRSTVTNLNRFNKSISTNNVLDILSIELTRLNNAELIVSDLQCSNQLDHLETELSNWNWVFGHTPKFKIKRIIESSDSLPWSNNLVIEMEIDSGLITEFKYEGLILIELFQQYINDFSRVIRGCRFFADDIERKYQEFCENIEDIKIKKWLHFIYKSIVNASFGL